MKDKVGRYLDAVAYWTLPPGIRSLLSMITRNHALGKVKNHCSKNETRLLTQRNAIFKNCHIGERCFILATGPSVREQDLTVLQGELCIAVSHFFLHKDIRMIKPRYHVLAPYHHPFTFVEIKKVFDDFNKFYTDDTIYLFGHSPYEYSVYNFMQKNPDYARKNSYFIDYTHSSPLEEDNFSRLDVWDISKHPFQIRTVIYTAIQAALYMGCREIYLIGCDHDYLTDMKRVSNHHFYKEEEGVSDVEHLSTFTSERWFGEYYFRWKQYRLIQEYAKLKGCAIVNSTKGGLLDVFPRLTLDELFGSVP